MTTQPIKLPDDLFPEPEWREADYMQRVQLLLSRYFALKRERDLLLEAAIATPERVGALPKAPL